MSLLDVGGLPPEFLEPVEFEEVELVENDLDLDGGDGSAAVVYVNNDSDNFVPEEVYQWADGTVTIEKVVDNGEEVALQPFIDGEDTVYNDPQFEYEEDVEVDVEGQQFLDLNIPANNSNPTHFVDYDGVEYIEAGLFPVASEGLVDNDVITGEDTMDDGEMFDDCEASGEYEAVAEAEPMNTGRRKPATIVQCEICGVLLKHPSKIEAHMRTHTGEKPFECNFCGMKFTQRTPMLNHIRRHLGQMPYTCSYGCGKKFVNNAQRNAHELRHLGTKRAGPPRPHLKPPKRTISTKAPSKSDTRVRQSEEERSTMVDFAPSVGQIEPAISATASKRLDEIIESVVSGVPIKKRKVRPSRAPMLVQCQICGLMLKHASKIR
ncbi:zinc finger, C2H2 type, partial [Ostertagia ostertagi]